MHNEAILISEEKARRIIIVANFTTPVGLFTTSVGNFDAQQSNLDT